MDQWMWWIALGLAMAVLELVLPGGIIFFLGLAAIVVGLGLYLGLITGLVSALLTWFISSLILIIFLRSLFIKYFEGDSSVDSVDEDSDMMGSVVEVIEDILPHKQGRVRHQDSTWSARSDEKIVVGSKGIIYGRDGNVLLIKTI